MENKTIFEGTDIYILDFLYKKRFDFIPSTEIYVERYDFYKFSERIQWLEENGYIEVRCKVYGVGGILMMYETRIAEKGARVYEDCFKDMLGE